MTNQFEQFGKYVLLEKLATGGMAEVFLARGSGADGIGKFFAIKRILPQFADSPEFVDMFKAEAKIAINLSHSNIVSIHEFGVQNNQFFLVMDYVEGRNLRQILNKMKQENARLSVDQVVYIIKEVSSGLDHAHRCLDGATGKPLNITHRDMSPQNIMLSFEGAIKIVDFGIAKAESQMESTRAGTLKGKFGYMSPEQAEGQPVDLRTDIFSLGIVLWELLANDRLFVANNEINTLRKIRDCQIPSLRKLNPNIPPELERIVQKALARDRNLRYQTSAAFHRDLNRFLNRQYPDFSPQDFSVTVKSLFKDDILSHRKRLIDYSKIEVHGARRTQTESAGSNAQRPGTQTSSLIPQYSASDVSLSGDSALSLDHQTHGSLNFGTFKGEIPKSTASADGPTVITDVHGEESKRIISSDSKPIRGIHGDNTGSQITQPDDFGSRSADTAVLNDAALKEELKRSISVRGKTPYALEVEAEVNQKKGKNKKDGSSLGRPGRISPHLSPEPSAAARTFLNVSMVVFVLAALYFFLIRHYPKEMAPVVRQTTFLLGPVYDALGITGDVDLASQPKIVDGMDPVQPGLLGATQPLVETLHSVIVSSTPSGSEILIDDKPTGLTTPAKLDVPADRPFSITLRRQGYLEYTKPDLTAESIGTRFQAHLQRTPIGYIDLDVSPSGQSQATVVSINGKLLHGEQLPLRRYAIPAGSRMIVRVENPISGASAEQTVTVSEGQRLKLELKLPEKTRPR